MTRTPRPRFGRRPLPTAGLATLVLLALLSPIGSTPARAQARPDLVVTAISSARTVAVGGRLRVEVTVINRGNATAPRSNVGVALTLDDRGGIGVGTVAIPRLPAKASATVTARRRVPVTTPPEPYVVMTCADPARRVAESNEGNNCRRAARTVTLTRRLDAYARIDAAVARGQLSPERGLVYKVYADTGDPALPTRFGPVAPTFDAAPGLDLAARQWDSLSRSTQQALTPYFTPPGYGITSARDGSSSRAAPCPNRPLDHEIWSSIDTEHFRFWYFTRNPRPDVLNLPDPAVSRAAAEAIAAVAEHVYDLETSLWREPLSDAGVPCNGGDGRVDVYLMRGNAKALAQVRPYPPGDTGRPGWMYIDPTKPHLRDVFAHELAHVIQLAYEYPRSDDPLASLEYGWLEEASATWAIDYVYPGDDYEHRFDGYLREGHAVPLGECGTNSGCDRGYRDWIFFYFLTQHLQDAGVMTRIWDNVETMKSVAAIDRAVGGQFASLFAAFALRGLNRANYDDFRSWDGFTAQLRVGPGAVPYEEIELDGKARRTWQLPGHHDRRQVYARSYKLDQYEVTDPDVRRIELRDFGFDGDTTSSDVRIKAWIELADGTHRTEDWTDLDEVEFCRDRAAEDVQRLVLFYIDGERRPYLTTRPVNSFTRSTGTLKAWNRCEPVGFPERWTGTASGTNKYGDITESWSATVVLAKQTWSSAQFATYGAVRGEGTWKWKISGTTPCPGGGAPRSVTGSTSRAFWPEYPGDPDFPAGEQLVLTGPDATSHPSTLHVNLNPFTPQPLFGVVTYGACNGTPAEVDEYTAMNCVRDAESEYLPYTPEMRTIAGSRSYNIDVGCGGSNPVTATWNLTAAD